LDTVEIELDKAKSQPDKDGNPTGNTVVTPHIRMPELWQEPFRVHSVAITGLFLLAIFYTIYFLRSLLLPLVLALLLSFLLRPIVRGLARLKIPPLIGAALLLLSLVGALGYGVSFLAAPAAGWIEKAPYSLRQLQQRLTPIKKPMAQVAQASGAIEKLTAAESAPAKTPTVEVRQHPITDRIFANTSGLLVSTLTMVILLYFMLAYDEVFLAKLIKLMPTLSDKKRAVTIAHEIQGQISRYLFTITMINIGLGIAVGTAVGFLGLPNPMLWGVLVTLLNFIPYLGAFAGICIMLLAALLSFNSLGFALIFPATYLALATIEGNFITPVVMGRSLTLNPVLVLLSLMFWGWIWGVVGVILAVPILATFKIFCTHLEPMEPLAEFMS
jgi:predicted PurR-regulated permease PerM